MTPEGLRKLAEGLDEAAHFLAMNAVLEGGEWSTRFVAFDLLSSRDALYAMAGRLEAEGAQ